MTFSCQHGDRFVTVCAFKIANFAEMPRKVDKRNFEHCQETLSAQQEALIDGARPQPQAMHPAAVVRSGESAPAISDSARRTPTGRLVKSC